MVGELRPWFSQDNARQAAIRELWEDHERAHGEMRSEFPPEVWAIIQVAEFLVEHPEALALRTQRIEAEMADRKRGNDPLHQ